MSGSFCLWPWYGREVASFVRVVVVRLLCSLVSGHVYDLVQVIETKAQVKGAAS